MENQTFLELLAATFPITPTEHSPNGPSSIQRREDCPGSGRMESGLKELASSDAATRGTLLHAAMASIISGETNPDDLLKGYDDDADALALRACLNWFRVRRVQMQTARVIVEKTVSCTSLHDLCEMGTPDLVLVEPFDRALIADWKFGGGYVPPAGENLQLAAYACVIAEAHQCSEVEVVVVKAADGWVDSYTYDTDGLAKAREYLCMILDATRATFAPCRPSADACRYCRASGTCEAQIAIASKLPVTRSPSDLAPSELARVLDHWMTVKQMGGAVEKHAYAVLSAGGNVPGWTLKAGRKSYSWNDDVDEKKLKVVAKMLGKPTDKFVVKTQELVTVSGGKKILGTSKAAKGELLKLITEKPGRLMLAQEKKEGE